MEQTILGWHLIKRGTTVGTTSLVGAMLSIGAVLGTILAQRLKQTRRTCRSKPTWKKAELLPTKARPMRSLTAQEFCERLKLFESQRVAVLVSPKEVLFSIPKDLLCANSTFFDRAFNGKFKESVELTMHLPEDTVLAFQMLLQWVYTGNIIIDTNGGATEKIGIYLDFFKLADKIDLLGPLDLITGNFKQHLCHTRLLLERQSNCGQECATNGNQADAICSCRRDSSWIATGRHAITCDIVQANCVSKEAHIDLLRDGVITSEHIQSAFELLPDHVARQTLVRACVAPYIMSCTMSYKFKFSKELETVEDYCQSLLKEVALTRTLNNVFTDPLTKSALKSWVRKGDDRWVEVPMSL
ncbi:hypothetical protein BKA65DRAFT_134120 [Rhexocercosporidium sp. MPI-PUGE-AT-0058]|nr:hypothetical protein BKA65DRAFT_134120 [Rhexocercosporidium sp. MPI-PUGE-AT-0058]